MTQRVLVTGGCGFVGVPLVTQLVMRGDDVLVFDDMSRGSPERLAPAIRESVRIVRSDIRDLEVLREAMETHRPQVVIHLAALHFIPACDKDPELCLSINVAGTQAVLEAVASSGHDVVLVYASTAAVYHPDAVPHSEDSSRVAPTDVYGFSKLAGEQLVAAFATRTGTPAGVARLFNVYGPAETNPHLIPTIIRQAEAGSELRLGNLDTRRDYVFTEDVAAALVLLTNRTRDGKSTLCNVGTGETWTGHDIVDRVSELLGRALAVVSDADRIRESDRPVLSADNQRAQDLLGWRPSVKIEEGLAAALKEPVGPGVEWR